MKYLSWQVLLGISLVILSAIVYAVHYAIFRDVHHIFIYMVGDIAFVFIEVMMVTLIIHHLLSEREKRTRLNKLNMVIGAFFSEVGTDLLVYFSDLDPKLDEIKYHLIIKSDWPEQEFHNVSRYLRNHDYGADIQKVDLLNLRNFLTGKRGSLLRLLENPSLLEHESFTELLQSVFHLTEELAARKEFEGLPAKDYGHIAVDIQRAYRLLVQQWLAYMKHLKANYPHLFSLAIRTNPFDENASAIVS